MFPAMFAASGCSPVASRVFSTPASSDSPTAPPSDSADAAATAVRELEAARGPALDEARSASPRRLPSHDRAQERELVELSAGAATAWFRYSRCRRQRRRLGAAGSAARNGRRRRDVGAGSVATGLGAGRSGRRCHATARGRGLGGAATGATRAARWRAGAGFASHRVAPVARQCAASRPSFSLTRRPIASSTPPKARSASSPVNSPTCSRSSSSARSSRRSRSSAASSETRDWTFARSLLDCVAVRRQLLGDTLQAAHDSPRARARTHARASITPRIERDEPSFVAATLVEQRRNFIQRAVRIGHRRFLARPAERGDIARAQFVHPTKRARRKQYPRGVLQAFHALVRDVERRAQRRRAMIGHEKRVTPVEVRLAKSANASVPGVMYAHKRNVAHLQNNFRENRRYERFTGDREAGCIGGCA